MDPELSIIIVSYNVRQLLLDCIRSVVDTLEGISYEIIVVDNGSSDGSAEAVGEGAFPGVQVIANKKNVGFAQANNQGYGVSRGNFLLLLNPDTVVKPGAIRDTLEFHKKTPDAGITACRLLNSDGTLQKSICVFPAPGDHILKAFFLDRLVYPAYRRETYYREKPFTIDYCSGAFLMVRREAVNKMPLLNPEYFMYSEEKDLSLRLKKKGWNTYFVPYGEVIHLGEQSTGKMAGEMFLELQKSQALFFSLNYRGVHKWLLAGSWWLVLLSSFVASIPFAFTAHGRSRLKLMMLAAWRYPSIVFRAAVWPGLSESTSANKIKGLKKLFARFIDITKDILSLPEARICMFGDVACRKMYDYFTAPHPHYRIIQNKRWGAALMQLPGSMEEYLSGKHKEYLRRMRNRAVRQGFRFGTADPLKYLDDMLAINMSVPIRQGRAMDAEYLDKASLLTYFQGRGKIYCIFDSRGTLRAYADIPIVGDVGIFNRILGHDEDLDKGVMYLLVSEIVREMITLKKSIGRPNWMEYDTFFGGSKGIRYFKEKLGFMPYKVRWVWTNPSEESRPNALAHERLDKALL